MADLVRYGVLHKRTADYEGGRNIDALAAVIRSSDGGWSWHEIAEGHPDFMQEVADALVLLDRTRRKASKKAAKRARRWQAEVDTSARETSDE